MILGGEIPPFPGFCMKPWYSIRVGTASSAGHSYRALLLPPCACYPAPFCLLHWASMSNSETMFEQCWQRVREWLLRLRTKELPHCATYTLLTHSRSTH